MGVCLHMRMHEFVICVHERSMIGEKEVAAGRQHLIRAGHGRWGQVTDDGVRVLESE